MKMRVLSRSRQNDRLRMMLVLVHIAITSPQKQTINELIEKHEQQQDIEELESLDPAQSEDRMRFGNFTEDLSL
ncbi:hypothetical protein TNCV_2485101 [Trichonephila clavipes]|uniref:Uncharacterized protein n=1 Tax=Trichonephila clavipes TaxID=2585209 RepID=A0A8X6VZM2_TRICX|nr:hypothetical protein TNCV_2485101 [Trichonephila clavipes]